MDDEPDGYSFGQLAELQPILVGKSLRPSTNSGDPLPKSLLLGQPLLHRPHLLGHRIALARIASGAANQDAGEKGSCLVQPRRACFFQVVIADYSPFLVFAPGASTIDVLKVQ